MQSVFVFNDNIGSRYLIMQIGKFLLGYIVNVSYMTVTLQFGGTQSCYIFVFLFSYGYYLLQFP